MASDDAFDAAVAIVLRNEGGYVNDPVDQGGETNFGISKRSYPDLDIAALTHDGAIEIYRRDFWSRFHIDALPDEIAIKMLDTAVVCGPRAAIELLQSSTVACGALCAVDGSIGPATISACQVASAAEITDVLRAKLAIHFRQIVAARPASGKFLTGWLNRAAQ